MWIKNLAFLFLIILPFISFSQELKNGIFANINTDKGEILVRLEFEKVPITVANFVGLAEGSIKNNHTGTGEPFYNGLIFHRVIKNGIIQGGDPQGDGFGNPGYNFKDEFHKELKHDKSGVLSMANSGKNTNGSQFFITHRAIPSLDKKHTVFGNVIKGQEIVDAIEEGDKILKLTIMRIGLAAESFDVNAVFSDKNRKLLK